MQAFKRLDAFTLSKVGDGRVRTVGGAVVSLVSLAVMAALFLSELQFYFAKEVVDRLYVNTTMTPTIKASFDISFPEIPCGLLTVDAQDETGEPQMLGMHEIFKHRLDSAGAKTGEAQRHRLGEAMRSEADLDSAAQTHFRHIAALRENEEERGPDCGNCYGAGGPQDCCNTCAEVERAYEVRGWRFHRQGVAQCHLEALRETEREGGAEEGGCQVYGQLDLSRASGHFHIVPHRSLHSRGVNAGLSGLLDLLSFAFDNFNVSHTVNSLSFGDSFPGVRNPLDDEVRHVNDTHGMYQYYIKIVPTRYRGLNGREVESNQYAVTEHMRHLAPGSGRGLPGVYFYYELSPLQAVYEERRRGLGQFLTGVCAVVGGVYTVMGLVDTLVNSFGKAFHRSLL